jgi:Domain of unknown function (DUF1854)
MQTEQIDPKSLRLFYEPPGTLRLTVGDERSYPVVKLYQARPLSEPGRFLSFQNGKGEEITMVRELGELLPEAQETARVEGIDHIRTEFGVTYWDVRTDKGPRDFVVQSLSESCLWLSENHLLISDVDGNRFEIADRTQLDEESRARLDAVL